MLFYIFISFHNSYYFLTVIKLQMFNNIITNMNRYFLFILLFLSIHEGVLLLNPASLLVIYRVGRQNFFSDIQPVWISYFELWWKNLESIILSLVLYDRSKLLMYFPLYIFILQCFGEINLCLHKPWYCMHPPYYMTMVT